MSKAENQEGLSPEKYVSRKSKTEYIQDLNMRLIYEIIRQNRIPAASTFVDLVSNYDIVVHSTASLSLQIVTLPK